MTSNEFFSQLKDGEEYLSLLCTKKTYAKMPNELIAELVINSVRQKKESFKDDEQHERLIKNLRKAKKELQNYEYNKNNE